LKPSSFEYEAPGEVDEALEILARVGDDGKVLAGGQSLVPLLNFRLAAPAHLVDINGVSGLSYVRRSDGWLNIGAMTRQSVLERSPLVGKGWPLLHQALEFVAHAQIRNRGTVGGSIAHADPAAELPIALACLDGRVRVRSTDGERVVGWRDLFLTHLTTSIESNELLVAVEVPPLPERSGSAFCEFARRHGDFALGGAAVLVAVDEGGTCTEARIALLGAGDVPLRAEAAEQALVGSRIDVNGVAEAARLSVDGVEPTGDIHGSGDYRKRLIEAMVRRGVTAAAERATTGAVA
jgi:carbon-monoxide dehydrogenase medium subunit/6-hydroxypseudooxynicotine dehydrogenase subunit alpha